MEGAAASAPERRGRCETGTFTPFSHALKIQKKTQTWGQRLGGNGPRGSRSRSCNHLPRPVVNIKSEAELGLGPAPNGRGEAGDASTSGALVGRDISKEQDGESSSQGSGYRHGKSP